MAVKLNMNADSFFQKMLSQEALSTYADLVANGVQAEIGFYSVSLKKEGYDTLTINVPISTSSLMKGNGNPAAIENSVKVLHELIDAGSKVILYGMSVGTDKVKTASKAASAKKTQPMPASSDTVQSIANAVGMQKSKTQLTPGEELSQAMSVDYATENKYSGQGELSTVDAESLVVSGLTQPAPKAKVNLKEVVALVEAQVLGQTTRGTSPGSIYRAVAISPRVKVAARIQGPNVSLRAEGKPNAYEKGKMKALGFTEGVTAAGMPYWSVHMDTAALTPSRAIGAVLMDLGIDFEQQAKNLKEVSLEG